jgi:hypothetical protein
MSALLMQAHAVMLRRIVNEAGDNDELFAAAVQTLANETSVHAIIEALFHIAKTRCCTPAVQAAARDELSMALRLAMNIAERGCRDDRR